VEDVLFTKSSSISKGTLHLTAHHIIFRNNEYEGKEVWVSDIARVSKMSLTILQTDALSADISGQSAPAEPSRPISAKLSYEDIRVILFDIPKGFRSQ